MQNKEAQFSERLEEVWECSIQEKIVKENDYDYDYTFFKNKLKRLRSKNRKKC